MEAITMRFFPSGSSIWLCHRRPGYGHKTRVDDWRDEIIYQVVVDRFEDGDPSNNYNVDYRREAPTMAVIGKVDRPFGLHRRSRCDRSMDQSSCSECGERCRVRKHHGYWTQTS